MGKSCYEYAVGLIGKYPKSEKELQIKLYQKGFDSETVQNTLDKLKKDNFLNDKMFVQARIDSEVIRKGKPLLKVIQKLEMKGIDKGIINDYINVHYEAIENGISNGIEKEINQYKKKKIDGFDIIQKLLRKGYRLGDIKKVLTKNSD